MNKELGRVVYQQGDERIEVRYIGLDSDGYRVELCKDDTCQSAFETHEESEPTREHALALADVLITQELDGDEIPSLTYIKDGESETVGPDLRVRIGNTMRVYYRSREGIRCHEVRST